MRDAAGDRLAIDRLDLAPGRGARRRRAVDVHGDRRHVAPGTELVAGIGRAAGSVQEGRVVGRLGDGRVERGRLAHPVAVGDGEGQSTPAGEDARRVAVDDRSDRDVVDELHRRDQDGRRQRTRAVTPGPSASEEGERAAGERAGVDDRTRAVHVAIVHDAEVAALERAVDLPLRTEGRVVPRLHVENVGQSGVDARAPGRGPAGQELATEIGRRVGPIVRTGQHGPGHEGRQHDEGSDERHEAVPQLHDLPPGDMGCTIGRNRSGTKSAAGVRSERSGA